MFYRPKNNRRRCPTSFTLRLTVALVFLTLLIPNIPALPVETEAPIVEEGTFDGSPEPLAGSYPALINTTDTDSGSVLNNQRKVVRTLNGTLHAVHESGNEIFYAQSYDDGKNWVNVTNLTQTQRPCHYPAIATNGTNIYVAYVDGTDLRFKRSLDGGATWTPDTDENGQELYNGNPWWASDAEPPAIAASGSYVYVFMERNDDDWPWDGEIFLFQNDNYGQGAAWNTIQVTDNGNNDINELHPSAIAAGSTVYLAYVSLAGGDREVWYTRSLNNGDNWGGWTQLSTNTATDQYPSISALRSNVSVAWESNERGNWEINFRNSTDTGANWDPLYNISNSTSDSRYPSVSRTFNASYVVWQDYADHTGGDVFYAVHKDDVWSTAEDLTNSTMENLWPNTLFNITNNRLEFLYQANSHDPNHVLFTYKYVGPNEVPTLNWTAETGYSNDGLDPQGDTTGHVYTYRVDYFDADDDPPIEGYPQVWIDRNLDGTYSGTDEMVTMDEVSASDTTYSDGKRFTYTTTFDHIGNYTYLFKAYDDKNAMAIGDPTEEQVGPNIVSINVPPLLEWTEDIGYEDDGLDPEEGMVGDDFTFMIRYRDEYDDPPATGFPKVMFDMDGNGLFNDTGDEEATMMEVSPMDTSYDNGKLYYYNRTFDVTPQGVDYHYKFYVEDTIHLSNETEARTGPMVEVATEIPQLTFTGEPGYEDDGSDPDYGSIYTEFDFRINYSDGDNETPMNGEVEIGIDTDFNGTFEADEWLVMDEADPSDTNYTDGKFYNHSTYFPDHTGVIYNYSFRARDSAGAFAHGEGTGVMRVYINVTNTPPVLKWTNEENYTSDGLDPEEGTANLTEFTYRVKYEDLDDDPPANGYPMVGIDMDQNDDFGADEYFSMEEVSIDDTVYSDGKLYTHTHVFDRMGNFTYTFKAEDATDVAGGTPTGVFSGPTVDKEHIVTEPPMLDWTGEIGYEDDGVEPNTGTTMTSLVFKVTYMDADGDAPAGNGPTLLVDMDHDGLFNGTEDTTYPMIEVDENDTDFEIGVDYFVSLTFEEKGEYNYTFGAESSREGEAIFAPGQLIGTFVIARGNQAPTLDWSQEAGYGSDGVSPDTGKPGDTFSFQVVYTDPDNDPPTEGHPKVLIDLNGNGNFDLPMERFPMLPMDPADEDYTDGRIYEHTSVVFKKEGTYSYSFIALDSIGEQAEALNGTGPEITIPEKNEPPVLFFPDQPGYEFDGLDPAKGKRDTTFTFKIVYKDAEGDQPQNGYPMLLIDLNRDGDYDDPEERMSMEAEDSADIIDGRTFQVQLSLDPLDMSEDLYTYAFFVNNSMNQTFRLGDFEGPVVQKMDKDTEVTTGGLGDMFWLLLIVILAIICLVAGFAAGRSKRRQREEALAETEPQFREGLPPTAVPTTETEPEEPEEGATPEPEFGTPEPEDLGEEPKEAGAEDTGPVDDMEKGEEAPPTESEEGAEEETGGEEEETGGEEEEGQEDEPPSEDTGEESTPDEEGADEAVPEPEEADQDNKEGEI